MGKRLLIGLMAILVLASMVTSCSKKNAEIAELNARLKAAEAALESASGGNAAEEQSTQAATNTPNANSSEQTTTAPPTEASSFAFSGEEITRYSGSETTVVIPAQINGVAVTSIGRASFAGCQSLTNITIPNSVTSIRDSAFQDSGITSITIPNSVTSIEFNAFARCTSLTAINVDAGNTAYSSQDGVLYNKDKTTLIQYPGGKTGAFIIPNGVTRIGDRAFMSTIITTVTIPASVTSIGQNAFGSRINSVTFQGMINSANIHASAFETHPTVGLRAKYLADGTGTYIRPIESSWTWTKQ